MMRRAIEAGSPLPVALRYIALPTHQLVRPLRSTPNRIIASSQNP